MKEKLKTIGLVILCIVLFLVTFAAGLLLGAVVWFIDKILVIIGIAVILAYVVYKTFKK